MQRFSMPNVLKNEDDDDVEDEEWTYEYVTDSDGEEWKEDDEINEKKKIEDLKQKEEELKKVEELKKEELKKKEEAKKEVKKIEEKKKEDQKKIEEKKRQELKKLEEKKGQKVEENATKKSSINDSRNKEKNLKITKEALPVPPPPKPLTKNNNSNNEQPKKEKEKIRNDRSISPAKKEVKKPPVKEQDILHKSRHEEEKIPKSSTVEKSSKNQKTSNTRSSSVVKIKEPEKIKEKNQESEAAINNRKSLPRSHSLVGNDDPRNSLKQLTNSSSKNRGKSSSPFRSVSPVKSVNERRKAFINPEAPQLIINNIPRGNLLARFLKNPPKPPSPPPKKQFKWELPTTSKATESTYWKPPPKPQPYKSSAPEYKENPLIIEPILFPEEQKIYEEEKQKEEEVKKPKDEKKEIKKGSKEINNNKQKGPKIEEKKNIQKKELNKPSQKQEIKKETEKKENVKKPPPVKAPTKKKEEKEIGKKEVKKEDISKIKEEKDKKKKDNEPVDEEKVVDEQVKEDEETIDDEENVEDEEEVSAEIDEEENEEEKENEINEENEEEPKKKKRRKSKKSKKPKKVKTEKPKRKWIPPPRPPPEVIEMPPEERHLWEIGREEVRHGNRPSKMYAKREKADSIDLPYVLPWEACPALQSQTGMSAFGTQRDPKTKVDQGHIELVQGSLKPETVLPLFEESERTIAAQNELTSFGAHRKNVGKIVDSHEYITDDKLHLSEGVIPRQMLGSLQSHDLDPIWGNLRSQTTKVWQSDGTRTEMKCSPDSNTIIGRQFAPANPDNRAGNNIIDRRRLTIQQIEGIGELKPSRLSECIVPKIFSTDYISLKSGADFGSFRPTKIETIGGLGMSFDDEKLCKLVIPYQTAPSLR